MIIKYNRAKLLSKDNNKAYTIIEMAVFYSAFIIRKLIDCKTKVSDDVDTYKFTLKGVLPRKNVDLMHRWPDEGTHDWTHEMTYTKSGTDICNWLIHSFVFSLSLDEHGIIDGFYVSSDYDRNKVLFRVELKDWLAYMDFVSNDNIVTLDMHVDERKNDYVTTEKERGSII